MSKSVKEVVDFTFERNRWCQRGSMGLWISNLRGIDGVKECQRGCRFHIREESMVSKRVYGVVDSVFEKNRWCQRGSMGLSISKLREINGVKEDQ
ncbi:hypothetical protein V1502_02820 [Bacillus sp. SCS-153A]|uniref:hypothetical protein n=1 Tax=Rossellomorea sedimentorum TaxID=3115294 RepID=UPI003905F6D5